MRAARAWAGIAATAVLGGCLGIRPTETIHTGLDIQEPAADPVYYLPRSPQDGASKEEIITGFLRAEEVTGERLSVAQEYLTKSLVGRWDPGARTDVIDGSGTYQVRSEGDEYAVTAPLIATIDATGRRQSAVPKARAEVRMRLTQVSGQWRIDQIRGAFGRWVRDDYLDQVLRAAQLYYVSTQGRYLVPDVRWLPVTRLATGLAKAQLASPPAYLTGAVRNLPSGVRLSVDAVPVSAQVAKVTLAANPGLADTTARVNVWAELVAALTQGQTYPIDSVDITVEGASLEVPGLSTPVGSPGSLGFTALTDAVGVQPVVRVKDRVYPVDAGLLPNIGEDVVKTETSPFPAIPTTWSQLAMSFSGNEIAAVGSNGDGMARYRGETSSVPEDAFADQLTGPAYDRYGFIWVGGRPFQKTRPERLWIVDSHGVLDAHFTATPLAVPWLTGRLPLSVAVSPDGTRIAVVSTDARGGDSRLDIAGVMRGQGGVPTGLAPVPLRLAAALSAVRDVVWTAQTTVAVLGGTGRTPQPYAVTVGDEITPLGTVKDAQWLTTSGGERGLVIITRTNAALVRSGATTWKSLPTSIIGIASPGR